MGKLLLSAFADEYDDSFTAQLEALQKFGINYIELRFIDGKSIIDLSREEVKEINKKLGDFGIKASAIGSPLGKISLDDDINAHLEKAKNLFEIAETLKVQNIRCFSFYPPKDTDILQCEKQVYSALEKLVSLSENYNVRLCHENEAKIYGESPEKCLELIKHFDGKIKCVFDMGNFVLDGYEPYLDAYKLLKEHIEYFHIKDALAKGAIVPPGKGEARIAEIIHDYKNTVNKDVFITLEPHLETFSGLNALVGKKFENPYKFDDQKAAFTCAVDGIKGIINNA